MKKKVKDLKEGDVIKTWFGVPDNIVKIYVNKVVPINDTATTYKVYGKFEDGSKARMYAPANDEVEIIEG